MRTLQALSTLRQVKYFPFIAFIHCLLLLCGCLKLEDVIHPVRWFCKNMPRENILFIRRQVDIFNDLQVRGIIFWKFVCIKEIIIIKCSGQKMSNRFSVILCSISTSLQITVLRMWWWIQVHTWLVEGSSFGYIVPNH